MATMDQLLKVGEVAQYLRIGRSILYRLTRLGAIPVRRVGRQLRYCRLDLEAWTKNPVWTVAAAS